MELLYGIQASVCMLVFNKKVNKLLLLNTSGLVQ